VLARRGQSVHFGVELDPVDPGQAIEFQEREALALIEAAVRSRAWWHQSGRERLDRVLMGAR